MTLEPSPVFMENKKRRFRKMQGDDRRLRVSDPEPCRSSAAVSAVFFGKAAPLARRIP